jgi:exosortase D (VPLPA-CTERM-specific)
MSMHSVSTMKAGAIRTALLVLVGLACISVFRGTLLDLMASWNQEEYSHGFFIPAVAAWLLWSRRDTVRESFGSPAWTGLILLLVAMAMHITGELGVIHLLSQLAFIVALLGIVLGIGGFSLLRVTFIPIAFLTFAIPPPPVIVSILTLKLQLISSELGTSFVRMFAIPVYLDGDIIDLGYHKLQVVEACSGLRYLFPLLSLGFLSAYLFHAPLWQRIVVFLSTIPITIVMNSIRIGMVGVTVAYWGPQMGDEVLHAVEGWVIFMACLALLAAEIYLFARFSGKALGEVFRIPKVAPNSELSSRSIPTIRQAPIIAALCILCVSGLMVYFMSARTEIIPERPRFAAFPPQIGQWHGRASSLDAETEQFLHLDDYLLSDYVRPDGKQVGLYVAYYASQHNGKGATVHPPLLCLPGGGWNITGLGKTNYPDAGRDGDVAINRLIIEQVSTRQVVYYWYDERGRRIANEYLSRWHLLIDAITKNRTDGSLVRLTTPIFFGETERDADERLQSFMRDILPSLTLYLPSDASPLVKSVLNNHYDTRS